MKNMFHCNIIWLNQKLIHNPHYMCNIICISSLLIKF
jgi:hypothetical protein